MSYAFSSDEDIEEQHHKKMKIMIANEKINDWK